MIDDKCPTCPMYGKGYCDCGRSKHKTSFSSVDAILLGLIFLMIALGVWKVIELIINK